MVTILYLDLEGTIIDDIDTLMYLNSNIDKILSLVKSANEIIIFSWAVCEYADFKKYEKSINEIENRLGRKFDSVILRDEIYPFFRRKFGNIDRIEFTELCQCLGKEAFFQFCIRNVIKCTEPIEHILIDDRVENTLLECKVNGILTKIRTININEYVKEN